VLDVDAMHNYKLSQGFEPGINNPVQINVGGDTIGSATPIASLPYADSGNTCSYVNNYDAVCPYTGSLSPDVVYSFSPGAATAVDIDLCTSLYDTKVYVYANNTSTLVACNDDACGSDAFKSVLECVPLTPGNVYYIVVDGYFGDCGDYDLVVSECTPCIVNCPAGGVLEGEPDCANDTQDTYNGGCNSNPPVWTAIPCDQAPYNGTTMCGTYGGFTYFGLSYRDTDWYTVTLTEASAISWCVEGEYDSLIGIIDGNAGCPVTSFYDYNFGSPCASACVNANLPAGEWWFFVATSGFGSTAGPCGGNYNATLTGYNCPPVSVEAASWGSIKNLYR
jgi:hypothetical protein